MIADKQIYEMNDSVSKVLENSNERTKTYSTHWIICLRYDENHLNFYYQCGLPYLLNYQNQTAKRLV